MLGDHPERMVLHDLKLVLPFAASDTSPESHQLTDLACFQAKVPTYDGLSSENFYKLNWAHGSYCQHVLIDGTHCRFHIEAHHFTVETEQDHILTTFQHASQHHDFKKLLGSSAEFAQLINARAQAPCDYEAFLCYVCEIAFKDLRAMERHFSHSFGNGKTFHRLLQEQAINRNTCWDLAHCFFWHNDARGRLFCSYRTTKGQPVHAIPDYTMTATARTA